MLSRKQKSVINQGFRGQDDSGLHPIYGRFNVTNRAIRQAQEIARVNGEFSSELEYTMCLEELMSRIVNDTKYH
jgi:hypothetical protein